MTYMKNLTSDLIVVGAGPAGLMTASAAALRGASVTVLDPNPRTGKKLRITGKGRCNLTNNCEPRDFLTAVRTNAKFFRSALYAFPPSAVMDFFTEAGVELKTERGNRVFPTSDNANDIADTLERVARDRGVRIRRERVTGLWVENGVLRGVKTGDGAWESRSVALCTGGLSYPATGSTGDGYALARSAGHRIVPTRASLVPWEGESVCARMQGLSLRNVTLSFFGGDKLLFREQGEMLFTHFGVSGPLMLSASTYAGDMTLSYRIELDLKPALPPEKLDERLLRDFSENSNRDLINALDALLPKKLIPVMVERSGIGPHTKVNTVTREQRLRLRDLIKAFPVALYGPRPVDEAIVTAGGVDVSEVQPRTMESKLLPGLYFAGEILDIDGRTGGYNLQIAWSTGHMAGQSVPLEDRE